MKSRPRRSPSRFLAPTLPPVRPPMLARVRASALALGLASLLFATAPAFAQDASGDWYGIMDAGAVQMRFNVHVSEADGVYSATLDVPEQDAEGVPLDPFTVEDGVVTWKFAPANVEYEGFVDPAFTRINGTFTQGSQTFPLNFGRTQLAAPVGSEEWARERVAKHEVMIPMRDGVDLFTSYYVPKDTTRTYPILLRRTPYNIEPGGEDSFTFWINMSSHFVEEGYILAFQDVRGKFMSEGEFVDVRPHDPDKRTPQEIDESSDTWDTIDWLVNNVPRNNGRVGILGVSYPGFYSTMALPGAHEALKAVSPQAPVTVVQSAEQ